MTAKTTSTCNHDCVLPKPYTHAQHCKSCHRTFTGPTAADKHRKGKHGTDRRCMTDEEMARAGLAFKPNRQMWGWGGLR